MTFSVPAISSRTAANMTRPAPLTILLPSLAGRHSAGGHMMRVGVRCRRVRSSLTQARDHAVHERQRIAVRLDHDPDQPLLREGAVGARPRGRPLPRTAPPAADPLAGGAA